MIVLLFLFSVVFPLVAIIPIRRSLSTDLCSKDYCSVIKGGATCFVIISHIMTLLGSSYNTGIFKIFDVLGGMGVLIFFFLSGYGLYIGYSGKKNYCDYIVKRIKNVVVPYLILKIVFWIIKCVFINKISSHLFFAGFDDWFIDVILIQYFIFFLAWKFYSNNRPVMLTIVLVANLILSILFITLQLNPRWYNALLMFPVGMFFAAFKTKIKAIVLKHRLTSLIFPSLLFLVFAGSFVIMKQASRFSGVLKLIAGLFLASIIVRLSVDVELGSTVMRYIGRNSLYFYIIHLELLKLLVGYTSLDPLVESYIIIVVTFIAVLAITNGQRFFQFKIFRRN